MVQPVARQIAGPEILDQDIRLRGQRPHQRLTAGVGEVHGDRLLAAVGRQEIGAWPGFGAICAAEERRPPAARVVAMPWPFDLDDLGPEVGQKLGGRGSGKDAGQVKHTQARKGPRIWRPRWRHLLHLITSPGLSR